MTYAPSKDSDQSGYPPSLIHLRCPQEQSLGPCYPLSAQRRLWSDWVDVQADLSLSWCISHFVGFVMCWLISSKCKKEVQYTWFYQTMNMKFWQTLHCFNQSSMFFRCALVKWSQFLCFCAVVNIFSIWSTLRERQHVMYSVENTKGTWCLGRCRDKVKLTLV